MTPLEKNVADIAARLRKLESTVFGISDKLLKMEAELYMASSAIDKEILELEKIVADNTPNGY